MLKIMSDKVEKAILVVPFWPAQNWFSLLNSNLISLPVRLPRHTDKISQQPENCENRNDPDLVQAIQSGSKKIYIR
jgi:hypothetical protein